MDKTQLIKSFKEIGICEGYELEVHSSLSAFGYVEGGARAVIDALIECVGEKGSIFMPSLCFSKPLPLTDEDVKMGITSKLEILPEDADNTGMGIIADTFCKCYDVVMGKGVIRTTGWGKNAQEAAKGGFDYIIANGGKALLLGVDIYRLTSMHYVEDYLPDEIKKIFEPTAQMNEIYPPDKWVIEAGAPPEKAWYKIQDKAYELGYIKDGYIGKCRYMLFDVKSVVMLYKEALISDPFSLYGIKK